MKKKMPEYAVFILSNRRPDRVYTYDTLRRHGYTGKIFIIVDDEDPTQDEYKAKYGEEVQVFDKNKIASEMDICTNRINKSAIVFARNACFGVARRLGLQCFIELDDDYTDFRYKFDAQLQYIAKRDIQRLDRIFEILIDFYYSIPAKSLAIAQGGDFFGGSSGSKAQKLTIWRKCMNLFICAVDREFQFKGNINEDVNTYIGGGIKGDLFLTAPNVALQQKETQTNAGGMSNLYLDSGTYVKSFYTVMVAPSCTRIKKMGRKYKRWHHNIIWNSARPVILRECWKKVKDDGRAK